VPRGDTYKECSRCQKGQGVYTNRIAYGGTLVTLNRDSGEEHKEALQTWVEITLCESCQQELQEFVQGV
jgi:hypothetical protein